MEFLTWWFDKHDVLSTIFTPILTIAWVSFNDGSNWRIFAACIACLFLGWGARS